MTKNVRFDVLEQQFTTILPNKLFNFTSKNLTQHFWLFCDKTHLIETKIEKNPNKLMQDVETKIKHIE